MIGGEGARIAARWRAYTMPNPNRSYRFLWLMALTLILVAGCAPATVESPTPPPPTTEPEIEVPEGVLAARDAVLDFMHEGAILCVPPENVHWRPSLGDGTVPAGFTVYNFNAEQCEITVTYPEQVSDGTVYHVGLHNDATGCCWQALVDDGGHIIVTGDEAGIIDDPNNPVAAYCTAEGYRYEVRVNEEGCHCGICVFEDDSFCNGWDFFRGECGPGNGATEASSG